MRMITVLLLGASLTFVFGLSETVTARDHEVGSGHIEAGVLMGFPVSNTVFWAIWGTTGPNAEPTPYSFPVPLSDDLWGLWIETLVAEHSGPDYRLEMQFMEDGRRRQAECRTIDEDGTKPLVQKTRVACQTPEGADQVIVYAHTGLDIHVTLVQS